MKIIRGTLGWGNRKNGLEAYGPGGRWEGHAPHPRDGDLLGDALDRKGVTEGAALIVVAITRRELMDHGPKYADAIQEAIRVRMADFDESMWDSA